MKYALVSTHWIAEETKSFHIVLSDLTLDEIIILKKNHDKYLELCSENKKNSRKKNYDPTTFLDKIRSNIEDVKIPNSRIGHLSIQDAYDYYENTDIVIPCISKNDFEKLLKTNSDVKN